MEVVQNNLPIENLKIIELDFTTYGTQFIVPEEIWIKFVDKNGLESKIKYYPPN
jgi:hypothetical protein